jgi:hypothetical protein
VSCKVLHSIYLCIVLPHQHPLKGNYKNGKMVSSLGLCTHREAVLKGTIRRAEVLGGLELMATLPHPTVIQQPPEGPRLREIYNRWKESKPRSSDSLNNCLRSVTLFEEFTSNTPINQLTREQGDGLSSSVQNFPRNSVQNFPVDQLNLTDFFLCLNRNESLPVSRISQW